MDVNKKRSRNLLFLEDDKVVVHHCILNVDSNVIDTQNQRILMIKLYQMNT